MANAQKYDSVMDGLQPSSWRGGRANTACVACHRLKMKCVRVGDSACVRCQRAARACYRRQPVQSDELQLVLETSETFRSSNSSRSSANTRHRQYRSKSHRRNSTPVVAPLKRDDVTIDSLPSVYSTSPFLAVVGSHDHNEALGSDCHSPRSPASLLNTPLNTALFSDGTASPTPDSVLSKVEIKQLLKMHVPLPSVRPRAVLTRHRFCARLLPCVPVLTEEDFGNREVLIGEQPELVQAICYVTSRYLPGALSTIKCVYPNVLRFLQDRSIGASWSGTTDLWNLRTLMILYAFSEAPPSGVQSPHTFMLPSQLLKAVTEIHGTQLGLHRSIEGIKPMMDLPHDQWPSTMSYKRYTYWLWLFTMSHHAIITKTPPTIRSDVSIRSAPHLFEGTSIEPRMRRLLGEVELCLLWEQASAIDSGLGEWWCPSDYSVTSQSSPFTALHIANHDLAAWRAKYSSFIQHGGYGTGLDFHYRFFQFCFSTYAVSHYVHNSDGDDRDNLSKAALDHAKHLLDWLEGLSPAAQESLRYISDFAFVMILFACLFIIQACESRHMVSEERCKRLEAVSTSAQFLVNLGVNATHFPSVYGKLLMKRLEKFQEDVSENPEMVIQKRKLSTHSHNASPELPSNVNEDQWGQASFEDHEAVFDDLLNVTDLDWFHTIQ